MCWFRHGQKENLGGWCDYRLRQDWRPPGVYIFPGFYCFWRVPQRRLCRESLQSHGSGHQERRPYHWPERFGWGQDSRRRSQPRRIRWYLPAKHPDFRSCSPNISDFGTLRWWSGIFPVYYRFHINDWKDFLYVHHRSWGHSRGKPRRSYQRRIGRSDGSRH